MAEKLWFADVILPLPLNNVFTYAIPEEQKDKVSTGFRVAVQFGKKRLYTAIVVSVHNNKPETYVVKEIISVLDDYPVVNSIQLKLWKWIAEYYMCFEGEVYKAAVPSGLKLESDSKIYLNTDIDTTGITISENEDLILKLLENNHEISLSKLSLLAGKKDITSIIKSLAEKKLVSVEQELREGYKPKMRSFVRLKFSAKNEKELHNVFDLLERSPKQLNVLMAFLDLSKALTKKGFEDVEKSVLLEKSNASESVLKGLVTKGIFEIFDKETGRLIDTKKGLKEIAKLNNPQQTAFDEIKACFEEKEIALLHGVTSSGKTEIYIHLIEEQIKQNKQVLYLLPEIALTAQIINRLKNVFGDKVGIYHSKFSDHERVEVWNNLLGKKVPGSVNYQVILGVRSSVFLPFGNLGLIIVDEEHENTYKQFDPSPRYHARDTAIVLASFHKAKVLLGTATPSIESYYNAKTGKYALVELKERYLNLEMPEIKIADVRESRKRKEMQSHFTPSLINSVSKALENKEQVILFQNRRGFAPYLECDICNWIPVCKHCDVSLTYHKNVNQLVCHYCGFTIKNPKTCSSCGGASLLTRGFGTEKIEDEMALIFPKSKIARLDLDSSRSRKSYEKIISEFENGDVDILVGTQMISKGLDFNNVKVVGIINADNMLNFPDFRSYERSYQLMSQVSGRAGRKNGRGFVIIQTSQPKNPVIINVIHNNYYNLFQQQLEERRNFNYPPFSRLVEITFKNKNIIKLNHTCEIAAKLFKSTFGTRVMGPEFPLISKIQDFYLKKFLFKLEKSISIKKSKDLLKRSIDEMYSIPSCQPVTVSVDVDPM